MSSDQRPLSPHLQVYRWQMTMVLSILHRVSGVGLALGLIFLTWWLVAAAGGAAYFDYVHMVMTSIIGRLFMFGFTLALIYHMCNGIRHLFWDAGLGFEKETAKKSSWFVLAATVVLTVAVYFIGYGARAGG